MTRLVRLTSLQYVDGAPRYPGDWVRVGSGLAEHWLALGLADEGPGLPVELGDGMGVIYVVYGDPAIEAARESLRSVRERHPKLPIAVISDRDPRLDNTRFIEQPDRDPGARLAKLAVARLTPFTRSLYLDADTVVVSSLAGGFYLLEAFDLVLAIDIRETANGGALRPEANLYNPAEREFTRQALPTSTVAQFACGMIFFRQCEAVIEFFDVWKEEWERWQARDQAAFLRALYRHPIRFLALPVHWNVKGTREEAMVIHHRWGAARRKYGQSSD